MTSFFVEPIFNGLFQENVRIGRLRGAIAKRILALWEAERRRQRRDRIGRAMRGFDRHLLRDIGLTSADLNR